MLKESRAGGVPAGLSPSVSGRRFLWPGLLAGLVLLGALAVLAGMWREETAGGPKLLSEAQLLALPPAQDWHVALLASNPAVLVIEFPGLQTQGRALNRIAAFVEKRAASRDRVLTDAQLAALLASLGDNTSSFLQGHDYHAVALARFFNQARRQGVQLNPEEGRLLQLLQDVGLLMEPMAARAADASLRVDEAWRGVEARALVTFTAVQPDDPETVPDETIDALRRQSVLRHELSHGEFFTDPAYRERCWRFWRSALSGAERDLFLRYLAAQGYEVADEDLMVNEMQALLLHTPDPRAFKASDLGLSEAELEALRVRFARQT